jgi:hypothetical protein
VFAGAHLEQEEPEKRQVLDALGHLLDLVVLDVDDLHLGALADARVELGEEAVVEVEAAHALELAEVLGQLGVPVGSERRERGRRVRTGGQCSAAVAGA